MLQSHKASQCCQRRIAHLLQVHRGTIRCFAASPAPEPRSFKALELQEPANAPLARDVRLLTDALAGVLRVHAPNALDTVEGLRKSAKDWRSGESTTVHDSIFQSMASSVEAMPTGALRDAARVTAQVMALMNTAETHHRVRRLQARRAQVSSGQPAAALSEKVASSALPPKLDSVAGTLDAIVEQDGFTYKEAFEALKKQRIEIVLTAHPTEVHRRTLLVKHSELANLLSEVDAMEERGGSVPAYEWAQLSSAMKREVASMWGTDELRRAKPSPQEEAHGGLVVLETTLWEAVPRFMRRLDAVTSHHCGEPMPPSASPVVFASWMGGDRDGNPNVTSPVTTEVVASQRRRAAMLYLRELDALRHELSIGQCSQEMSALTLSGPGAATRWQAASHRFVEPYRVLLERLASRLRATVAWADNELRRLSGQSATAALSFKGSGTTQQAAPGAAPVVFASWMGADWDMHQPEQRSPADKHKGAPSHELRPDLHAAEVLRADMVHEPIFEAWDLEAPLLAMRQSLISCGNPELADGRILDTLRRLAAFGLQLAPLDLRQESGRHREAVEALRYMAFEAAKSSGLRAEAEEQSRLSRSYIDMSEEERIAWLSNELCMGRPLLRKGVLERNSDTLKAEVKEVLDTAALPANLPPGSLGAYVISQAQYASDVLAVELLMAEMAGGGTRLPRVVPLFETLDDLQRAPHVLDALFQAPGYADRTGRKQEVMVGYSDSAKDAGRIAAMWAQYEAQEKMVEVARKHNFEISFFHGKGGTVGRGGNPELYRAVLAHPPGTIDGRFRVTEQGEMITFNFGHADVAERSLDIFTAAVLRDQFISHVLPKQEWRDAMKEMQAVSCAAYRYVVREDPHFVPYFRAATPEQELGGLNVGSRPAKRNPKGGVESLRAIPWIFAWSQTRFNLPAWLGVGDALAGALSTGTKAPVSKELLQTMYKEWPWFCTSLDMIEMLLSKTEPAIAAHYEAKLVPKSGGAVSLEDAAALGASLRQRLAETEKAVLTISGHSTPAEHNALLQRSLRIRNPFLDVLHLIQAESLLRLRKANDASGSSSLREDELAVVRDTLLITMNGIAAGLRNSG